MNELDELVIHNKVKCDVFDASEQDRLNDILDMIGHLAALNFDFTLKQSTKNDTIDAIILGLNMLSEELKSNVVQKEKLDELNKKLEKFAYVTAHDLKSPLNTIGGLASLIELSVEKNDTISQYLVVLRSTIDQMKKLISGILDYSRKPGQEIEREYIDLNKLVQELIKKNCYEGHSKIITCNLLPIVFYNKVHLIQIFQNLITNAIKHCGREQVQLTISSEEQQDQVVLSIADDGPGIPPELHNKIFELYFKVDENAPGVGHGIGLYTIKNIIESEGGKIWVDSLSGKGSRFSFTIKKIGDGIHSTGNG